MFFWKEDLLIAKINKDILHNYESMTGIPYTHWRIEGEGQGGLGPPPPKIG